MKRGLAQQVKFGAAVGLVLANRTLMLAGLRRRVDGWRHSAGLVLRGEHATFVLSAFDVDVWSDAPGATDPSAESTAPHIVERLEGFLAGEKEFHVRIRTGGLHHPTERCAGPSYTLGFEPWVDGPARFVRPNEWTNASTQRSEIPPQEVLLNVICRVRPDGAADIWVRVNHVGIDGVPAQELLGRLEKAWGRHAPTIFPTPEVFAAHTSPRPSPGREGIVEVQDFIDFAPLLKWRSEQNARLPEPMTVSAAILWCLSRHPRFTGLWMGTTVELPAIEGRCRGVGIVVVRPSDYSNDALANYVRAFNRELELTRKRRSDGCLTIDALALIPNSMASQLLLRVLEDGGRAFGSLGLTILRDASVFGAPLADAGHENGFIAIGSIGLNAGDGRRVGCVCVKGPAHKISGHPAKIREAIQSCGNGLS